MIARRVLILALLPAFCAFPQSFLKDLKAEPNPAKRADKALVFADTAFDSADQLYNKGDIHKGDEQLDYMTAALHECVESLQEAHKASLYKKAELRVAGLQRRLSGLMDNIGTEERGWAEYTARKVDEIHDALLEGVMRK